MAAALIIVDRERFRLEVWQGIDNDTHYRRAYKLPIAVGRAGTATPKGAYFVVARSRTPAWRAPDSEWVPAEDRGKVFPFEDPRNPFQGGFILLSGGEGIGIHGTKFDPEIGTRASHGCIRMRTMDLLKIYELARPGITVVIQ